MPSGPDAEALSSGGRLSTRQKIALTGFTLTTAGYAAFTDSLSCIFMIQPLRSEYQFEEQISEKTWLLLSSTFASLYGFYTFTCEGKGSYDVLNGYFLRRNQRTVLEAKESLPRSLVFSDDFAPPLQPNPRTRHRTGRQQLAHGCVRFAAAAITLVGSLSDSAETTMGLAEEGATLPKTITISSLSFLSAVSFYGPITLEAFEELFLGISPKKTPLPSHTLAKIIGYPIAGFTAIQDTLECGASLFQNFSITNLQTQRILVGVSSLGGISSLCLDGKRGVEILNAFFTHLETHYAWLPRTLRQRTWPHRQAWYALGYEASTVGLAMYAANYIALADKDLIIALSHSILQAIGAEVPFLAETLGWGSFLKNLVIHTNALNQLLHLGLRAMRRAWEPVTPLCCPGNALALEELPVMEEVELTVLPAREEKQNDAETPFRQGEEEIEEEDGDEETALLKENRARKMAADQAEKRRGYFPFFQARMPPERRDYHEPERTCCGMLLRLLG